MLRSTITGFLLILIASGIACAQVEKPITVSACQLKNDPDTYDHKLIQLQGTVSSEFEDFTLRDRRCPDFTNSPWLTYCGEVFDGVMYSCDGSSNKGQVVEGITAPNTKDPVLERFTRLVDSYRFNRKAKHHYFQTDPTFSVTATLVGRFFAGKPRNKFSSGRGFGQMGCCTLLVIQQVVSIDKVDSNLKPGELTYYTEGWHDSSKNEIVKARQEAILQAGEAWRKSDPQRVAADALSDYRKNSPTLLTFLGCTTKHLTYGAKKDDQYSTVCKWASTPSDSYDVEVLKYDFLKTPSNKWRDIAWMPSEITHTHYSDSASPE